MKNRSNYQMFDGFILKIMAIFFMTLDHIGIFLERMENPLEFAYIFRIFGRLSFPLIIFLLVEGLLHTKSIGKYFIRLGIVASVFLIGQLAIYFYYKGGISGLYSPAIDLLLTAATVYLLKRKDKFSALAILPIAWSILCLVVRYHEMVHVTKIEWVPFFLRPDYQIYGPLLGVAFFLAHSFTTIFLKGSEGTSTFIGTTYEQTTYNIISSILLIILTLLMVIIDKYTFRWFDALPYQMYSLFAFIPILFYSGKRGYNPKWFKYGCYIYFPMHFIILFLIFTLL